MSGSVSSTSCLDGQLLDINIFVRTGHKNRLKTAISPIFQSASIRISKILITIETISYHYFGIAPKCRMVNTLHQ